MIASASAFATRPAPRVEDRDLDAQSEVIRRAERIAGPGAARDHGRRRPPLPPRDFDRALRRRLLARRRDRRRACRARSRGCARSGRAELERAPAGRPPAAASRGIRAAPPALPARSATSACASPSLARAPPSSTSIRVTSYRLAMPLASARRRCCAAGRAPRSRCRGARPAPALRAGPRMRRRPRRRASSRRRRRAPAPPRSRARRARSARRAGRR